MPRLLILLTLPGNVRDYYAARLKKRFPELEIDIADHFSKATPLAPNADILLTFGPMMKDEVFANAPKLKWVQALGTCPVRFTHPTHGGLERRRLTLGRT